MDVENNVSDDNTTQVENQEEQKTELAYKTVEEALVALNAEKAERAKLVKDLENSRKGEKFNKGRVAELEKSLKDGTSSDETAKLLEQKSQELDTIKGRLKTQAIDSALREELSKSGAKSISTVLKIVDRSKITIDEDYTVDAKSVKEYVAELKKEDAVLFENVTTPDPKRSAERSVTGLTYKQEVGTAKTMADLEKIAAKHGIQAK